MGGRPTKKKSRPTEADVYYPPELPREIDQKLAEAAQDLTPRSLIARNKPYNTLGAGELLGVKPETLRKWRATGKGPSFTKMYNTVHYRRADLENWLKTRTQGNE